MAYPTTQGLPEDTDPEYREPVGATEGHAAADEVFRAYRGQIYRFLLRKTGDHHDAEELTQRVFVDAAVALGEREAAPNSPLGWLYSIAERRFIDDVRRRTVARRALRLLGAPEEAPNLAYGREIAVALRAAIGNLPEPQRRVVVLKILEGRSFAEIAQELGTTEAACKMRLSRAIAQIKVELERKGLAPGA